MDYYLELLCSLDIRKSDGIPEDYWSRLTGKNGMRRAAIMLQYVYGKKVLEIGSGRGYLAVVVCKAKDTIETYDGIDIEEDYVRLSTELALHNDVTKAFFKRGDGNNIKKIGNNYYDTIIMAEVLEHLKKPIVMLNEAYRVVKKYGNIIITVPTKSFMPPEKISEHVQDFTIDDIKDLISESGFMLVHHMQSIPWEFFLAYKLPYCFDQEGAERIL